VKGGMMLNFVTTASCFVHGSVTRIHDQPMIGTIQPKGV
jgi:hypothetical protein